MTQVAMSCDEVREGMCMLQVAVSYGFLIVGGRKSFLSYFFHLSLVISKPLYSYYLLHTFNTVFVGFVFSLPVLHVYFVNLPGGAFSCNPGFYIQRKCKYPMVGNLWAPVECTAGAGC